MKKLFIALLSGAIMGSCSCNPAEQPGPSPVDYGDISLRATIVDGGSETGDLSVGDMGVKWNVGDPIRVYTGNSRTGSTYTVTKTAGNVADLSGGLKWGEEEGSRVFYAYRGGVGFSYPDVTVPGPEITAGGSGAGFLNSSLLLVASPKHSGRNGGEPVGLKFYNTMSVIEFKLATTFEQTVSRIEIETANEVFAVGGKVDITAFGLAFGRITATERSKKASLTIDGTPALPVVTDALNPSRTLSFMLPVAAEGDSGVTTVSLATAGGIKKFDVTPVEFAAGKHYSVTLVLEPEIPLPGGKDNFPIHPALYTLGLGPDANGETILDFSRVGYKWGDEPIPSPATVKTLSPPAGGADATSLINDAIAEAHSAGGGVVLLRKGEYRVGGTISFAAKRNVVLRGEGESEIDGTRVISTSTASGYDAGGEPASILISMQGGTGGARVQGSTSDIVGDYIPAGQFWARVANPSLFAVGQDVAVKRKVTQGWIDDLRMATLSGWSVANIDKKLMERVITKISADTLWFENPLSICIEPGYGGGTVCRYSYGDRIEGCGVENMFLGTVSTSNTSENHAAVAIYVNRARHCWVSSVTSARFSFCGVGILQYATNITVAKCTVLDMHSTLSGSRRYPFLIKGQLSLVRDCYCETARHAFSTSGPTTNGPNVFVNCRATQCYYDNGPHQRMATGTLYDNLKAERTGSSWSAAAFAFMDRGTADGHGWTELNGTLWNIETDGGICVQKPWVSGNNYGVGCIGVAMTGYPGVGSRDRGRVVSFGAHVAPLSLYEAQLALRKENRPGGVMDVR